MRFITIQILIGTLLVASTMPYAVAQAPSDKHVQGDANADRQGYVQRARDEMEGWRQRLDRFDVKAKANGRQAGDAADRKLHAAWTETAAGAEKLQNVGADGWEDAKSSYERASSHLADAWARVRPEDK